MAAEWQPNYGNEQAQQVLTDEARIALGGINVATQVHELPKLPDIDAIEPLNEKDLPCIQEIQQVLEKYGSRGRFGLHLLHEHFDVAPDEAMVETVDYENRIL